MTFKLDNYKNHIDVYSKDINKLLDIEDLLEQDYIEKLNISDLKSLIENKIMPTLNSIEHPVVAEYIFGMAMGHPHTYIRACLVDVVECLLQNKSAELCKEKMQRTALY